MGPVTILNVPSGGAFTRAERDALPNDGRRHELLHGFLVVTPSPRWDINAHRPGC